MLVTSIDIMSAIPRTLYGNVNFGGISQALL